MKHYIELIWYKDSSGYELLPHKTGVDMLDGLPERICGKGGKKNHYSPLGQHPFLFREFANIEKTPEGLLGFIQKYGRLKKMGNYDDVLEILKAAKEMKLLVNGGMKKSNLRVDNIAINSQLIFDSEGKPSLILAPADLLTGLWLQLGESLSNENIQNKVCLLCGGWFDAGPGAGRRFDAQFCSDEHRITYNSRMRSKKPKPKLIPKTKAKPKPRRKK